MVSDLLLILAEEEGAVSLSRTCMVVSDWKEYIIVVVFPQDIRYSLISLLCSGIQDPTCLSWRGGIH